MDEMAHIIDKVAKPAQHPDYAISNPQEVSDALRDAGYSLKNQRCSCNILPRYTQRLIVSAWAHPTRREMRLVLKANQILYYALEAWRKNEPSN